MNHKRIESLWRQEELKVPKRQRLWMNDGSYIRLRPKRRNHVWSYDFVHNQTSDEHPLLMFTLIDARSRECLTIDVKRRLNSEDVIDRLKQLFCRRGTPDYIQNDNGAEFTCHKFRSRFGPLDRGPSDVNTCPKTPLPLIE